MKKAVNTHEAKTQLSRLRRRVTAGEEITIANRGVPVARLTPIPAQESKRRLGMFRGKIGIAENFDAALPEMMLAAFEGQSKRTKKKT